MCDRDTNVTSRYDELDQSLSEHQRLVWSHKTHQAVEALVKNWTRPKLELPKVFVYPFPPAFKNATWLLEQANCTESDVKIFLQQRDPAVYQELFLNPASTRELTYFELIYGAKVAPTTEQFVETNGTLRWVPSLRILGKPSFFTEDSKDGNGSVGSTGSKTSSVRDPKRNSACTLLSLDSQHSAGLLIHRGLETSYARLVRDPSEADLFFVPDHWTSPDVTTSSSIDAQHRLCSVFGRLWLEHLSTFRVVGSSASYAARHQMRDHFFARNRAWHRWSQVMSLRDLAQNAGMTEKPISKTHGCCSWTHTDSARNAAKLWVETQDPFQRSIAKQHPVPYFGSYSSDMFDALDSSSPCTFESRVPRRSMAAALMSVEQDTHGDRNDSIRKDFFEQCEAWDECVTTNDLSKKVYGAAKFSFQYLQTTFCINPPGISAARKGIVDALVAGCIPVLVYHETKPGYIYPWTQDDLWPWHWDWQSVSSLSVPHKKLRRVGIRRILEAIPQQQIRLMQTVIRQNARSLLWPVAYPTDLEEQGTTTPRPYHQQNNNALDITMHHLFALTKAATAGAADAETEFARSCSLAGLTTTEE